MLLGLLISGCVCGALLIVGIVTSIILWTSPKEVNSLLLFITPLLSFLLAFGTILLLSFFGAEYSEIKATTAQISMIL